MKFDPIYYGDYLQLDKILNAQSLKSAEHGKPAHDEMLFIVIHQAYELWFKQILFEVDSIATLMQGQTVLDKDLATIVRRLERVIEIQRILNAQIKVIETMTSLDFMEFRDYLVPASGFQSVQFRLLEIKLGLKKKHRLAVDADFFNSRLNDQDRKTIMEQEEKPSVLELLDSWLARMPFSSFKNYEFWKEYKNAVDEMLSSDKKIIESNTTLSALEKRIELGNLEATRTNFDIILDEKKYQTHYDEGTVRLSRKAKLAAIFIKLYRDEPVLQLPHRILDLLIEIDEMFTTWRYQHSFMVHRMLGTKIGTGGSSGHDYLKRTAENNRVYLDLFNLATFLIPKDNIPALPSEIKRKLGFIYQEDQGV